MTQLGSTLYLRGYYNIILTALNPGGKKKEKPVSALLCVPHLKNFTNAFFIASNF